MTAIAMLHQLRRQAGAAGLPISVGRPSAADSAIALPEPSAEAQALVAQLRAALARRAYHQAMQRTPAPQDPEVPDIDLGERIAPGVRLLAVEHDDVQSASIDLPWLDRMAVARSDLAAFDIETTGMNAGVGVRAFLVGIADWCGDRLRVRQLLLESPTGEAAQLDVLADWIGCKSVLLSYNGKSFDVPMMNGRYPLFGKITPFDRIDHLDLLPVVRRTLRDQLTNCKLGTVEREWLGIVRQHDLPSSEVPASWHRWLRTGKDDRLKRAIAHHRQDLVTLWRLLDRLTVL